MGFWGPRVDVFVKVAWLQTRPAPAKDTLWYKNRKVTSQVGVVNEKIF